MPLWQITIFLQDLAEMRYDIENFCLKERKTFCTSYLLHSAHDHSYLCIYEHMYVYMYVCINAFMYLLESDMFSRLPIVVFLLHLPLQAECCIPSRAAGHVLPNHSHFIWFKVRGWELRALPFQLSQWECTYTSRSKGL